MVPQQPVFLCKFSTAFERLRLFVLIIFTKSKEDLGGQLHAWALKLSMITTIHLPLFCYIWDINLRTMKIIFRIKLQVTSDLFINILNLCY